MAIRTPRPRRPRMVVPPEQQGLPIPPPLPAWTPVSPEMAALRQPGLGLEGEALPSTGPVYGPEIPAGFFPQPPEGFQRPGLEEPGNWQRALDAVKRSKEKRGLASMLAMLGLGGASAYHLSQGPEELEGTAAPPVAYPPEGNEQLGVEPQVNPEQGLSGSSAANEVDIDLQRELESVRNARGGLDEQLKAFALRMALGRGEPLGEDQRSPY